MVTQGASKVILQIIFLTTFYAVTTCAQGKSASILNPALSITASANASSLVTPALHNISVTITAAEIKSTTIVNVTSSSIQPPKSPTKPTKKPSPKEGSSEERRFDGLSFFGGMILGAAVCIIIFFALKYYRAKKRSYHSL